MARYILWVANGFDTREQYSDHYFVAAPHWQTIAPFGKTEGHTDRAALRLSPLAIAFKSIGHCT